MKINDLYASVTSQIVQELESGAAPWLKPWKNGKTGFLTPTNAATGRPYSGINIPLLWSAADARSYPTHGWMTYKQALEAGARVRKGEKATTVVFTKKVTVGEDEEEKRVNMLRTYFVFNAAQIDGLPQLKIQALPIMLPIDRAQAFIEAIKADIRYGGNMAAYIPSRDYLTMPLPGQFKSEVSFYATSLHEHAHWSGAPLRLDRDLSGRFGTWRYAAEELIAELTAAFLCAHLGITGELRHAGYIKTWIELLKNDDRAIFTAASKASQAADYLRSFSKVALEEPA